MRAGRYSVPGVQAPIVRRRLADFAAQSAPYFDLERVFRGLPPSGSGGAQGIDTRQGVGATWLQLSRSRYMFLLFTKRAGVS